jgi:hypothetical protein
MILKCYNSPVFPEFTVNNRLRELKHRQNTRRNARS